MESLLTYTAPTCHRAVGLRTAHLPSVSSSVIQEIPMVELGLLLLAAGDDLWRLGYREGLQGLLRRASH